MIETLAEPFDAILELGGEPLREAMAARRDAPARDRRRRGALRWHTVAAGGKRLRPLLVFVAGPRLERARRSSLAPPPRSS